MTLMADRTAPTGITDEQRLWLTNHPKVQARRERCKILTTKCRQMGYASWKMAEGTHIYAEKLKNKNRRRHFRDADVRIFNQQFRQSSPPKVQIQNPTLTPPVHGISERRELIRIICHSKPELTWKEEHIRRLECIRLFIQWQSRQESPRRGRMAAILRQPASPTDPPICEVIPEKYEPKQCPFCVSNLSKPRHERERPLSRISKMWNHVENIHCQELAAFASGNIPCPICKAREVKFIPSNIPHFKSHTQKVHDIRLRA